MVYKHITENVFSSPFLDEEVFAETLNLAERKLAKLSAEKSSGDAPHIALVDEIEDLTEMAEFADWVTKNFKKLVVLGTGGSSLTGQALAGLKQRKFGEDKFKVVFMDNIDPQTWDEFLQDLVPEETAFLGISKSGESMETLLQFMACSQLDGVDKHDQFFVIAAPGESSLRSVAADRGIKTYNHIPNLSGRFSIFSNVGLMPAMCLGFDAENFRFGAKEFLEKHIQEAAVSASLHMALMRKNIWNNVLMTYPDKLWGLSTWYRQIWAESIGKNKTGSTPVRATGTLDQHSQMQLYLDGRRDKFFSLVSLKTGGDGLKFAGEMNVVDYVEGKTLGDVFAAAEQATYETIAASKLPVRLIELDELNEFSLGMLTMHLMLETILVAEMLGVNPYDQPAVEDGKIRARKILGSRS